MTFSLDLGPLLPYWSVFLKSALLTLKMTTNTSIGDSDAAAASLSIRSARPMRSSCARLVLPMR